MGYVIGIDIGGSTTKIVGLKDRQLISHVTVKADDPLTSAYGAFGKFLNINGLGITDVDRIMFTGVGSSFIEKGLYNIPSHKVDEFLAIGHGGKYLSGFDKAIIVSMGTGTAFVKVVRDEIQHIGGTGVGGGTLVGLSSKVFNIRDIKHIVELAKEGSLANVDLTIGDISDRSITNMTMETTASNFGKMSDVATNADIAMGLINLVFQTIGMFSVFASRADDIRDVVLTGNMTAVPQAKDVFKALETLYDVKFLIPDHAEYATAIGAALAEI